MNKRLLLVGMSIVLVCAIGFGSTFAFFNSRDTADNVFTVGAVDIALEEPTWNGDEHHTIVPGAEFKKDPTVTNTGANDAYVRMRVSITDLAAFKASAPPVPGGGAYDLATMFNSTVDATKWTYAGSKEDSANDRITFYYVFNDKLKAGSGSTPGDSTGPLFTSVTIPDFLTGDVLEAINYSFDVIVAADAIQADGFENATEALAAFDAQMGL